MSWNLTRWQLRALTGAAVILVGVAVYWAVQPGKSVAPGRSPTAAASQETSQVTVHEARTVQRNTAQQEVAPALPSTAEMAETADTEVATVAQYVSEKYEFLIDDARYLQASQVEQLRQALLASELRAEELKAARSAGTTGDALSRRERALAQVEGQIRGMLHPADYATYEVLKESDAELFHLQQYAGGIENVAPLSAENRKSIMKTKLAYKGRFRQALRDSGLERDNLSATEREYAYSVGSRALEDFKSSYLKEVRQYLVNEEQYMLLSNYENTEFTAELAKLRSLADSH